jgi:glycosyltransferase involved in cell wall biosynthesis
MLSTFGPLTLSGNVDETVSVIIASYGDREKWNRLSQRALASVANQTRPPDSVYRIHHNSLHEARNKGADISPNKWLCFLDCDDELEPGYLEAMMQIPNSTMEIRYPRVRFVSENVVDPKSYPDPVSLPQRPLWRGNFMVIGSLVTREIFLNAGGFRPLEAYEDWDLWIRCWMLGADPRMIQGAIYRAHRFKGSRNLVKNPQNLCAEIIQYNREWQAKIKMQRKAIP